MCALNSTSESFLDSSCIPIDQFITVQAAAEISGYNAQYLRRLLRTGKLENIKIGQVWLIKIGSLESYLQQNGLVKDHRWGPKKAKTKNSSTDVNTLSLQTYTTN